MIAEIAGISCSKRCEMLLALSYLKSKDDLLAIAYRVANDAELSAVRLAMALLEMKEDVASEITRKTLLSGGIELS